MTRIAIRPALIASTAVAVAGIAAAFVMASTGSGAAPRSTPVAELPRVVVTGKVTPIAQLPRVVVSGKVATPEAVAAARQREIPELPRVLVTGRVTGAPAVLAQARSAPSGS